MLLPDLLKRYCLPLLLFAVPLLPQGQHSAPLKLIQSIPLPGLKERDFDLFAIEPGRKQLFLAGEANGLVEVFDIQTNKLIPTIPGMEATRFSEGAPKP
jgi:hypothetical protein